LIRQHKEKGGGCETPIAKSYWEQSRKSGGHAPRKWGAYTLLFKLKYFLNKLKEEIKKMKKISSVLLAAIVMLFSVTAFAGAPFNNLEGVGGIALNPLAYTAGTNNTDKHEGFSVADVFSQPQIGAWYVSLSQPYKIGWTSLGVAETLFKRVEVSYGYQAIDIQGLKNIEKHNFGGKLLLLEENFKELNFLPAISVGAIFKNTSVDKLAASDDSSSWDYYLVATKLITQLPVPVLLSAGVLSTQGKVTGILGYDKDRETTFFGNIDIIPIKQIAVGFEYKQGARFDDYKDADYWNVHAAWFVNQNFTIIAAYANAGDSKATDGKLGLGDGLVVSLQYAF
jgi:hypothetical protein